MLGKLLFTGFQHETDEPTPEISAELRSVFDSRE